MSGPWRAPNSQARPLSARAVEYVDAGGAPWAGRFPEADAISPGFVAGEYGRLWCASASRGP